MVQFTRMSRITKTIAHFGKPMIVFGQKQNDITMREILYDTSATGLMEALTFIMEQLTKG